MAHEGETLRLNEEFAVDLDELIEIVEAYRKRKFNEDIAIIRDRLGGIEELAGKLRTSIREGIKEEGFADRDLEFGGRDLDVWSGMGVWMRGDLGLEWREDDFGFLEMHFLMSYKVSMFDKLDIERLDFLI